MNIILIILVFGIIVFFHEFGHFIVAKMNHIAVTEFSIGMGPAIFSKEKNGTKYSLRILPLGGYCLMMGEDEESEDENAFGNKPVWARMLVIAAGPCFNFILAFVFAVIMIHFSGVDPAQVTPTYVGSPADHAGVMEGDQVLELGGEKIYTYKEVLLFIETHNSPDPISIKVKHKDQSVEILTIQPIRNEEGNFKMGLMPYNKTYYIRSENIGMDLQYAGYELRYWVKATVAGLRMIVTGGVKSGDLMGPVGVGGAMNDVIEDVKAESETKKEAVINILLNMLNWCVLLSVNLGIMNLLPIPALDGGRLLFLIVEAIRRKKIPQDKEALVNVIGFVLLIILMVVVFFNDIKNVFF